MAHSNRRVPASIAWLLVAVLIAVAHAVSEETTDLNGDGLVGEDPAPAGFPCPGGGGSPGFMLAVEWNGNAFRINGETGGDTPLGSTGFHDLNSLALLAKARRQAATDTRTRISRLSLGHKYGTRARIAPHSKPGSRLRPECVRSVAAMI